MKINTKSYSKLNTLKEEQISPEVNQCSQVNHRVVPLRYSWACTSFLISFLLTISIYIYTFIGSPIDFNWHVGKFVYSNEGNLVNEVGISWHKCMPEKYGRIKKLIIDPATINLNENLTIFFDGDVYQNLSSPISVQVKIKKKIWFSWVPIPCINDVGSCHYEDICELSPYAHDSTCDIPIPNSKLPCKCPIEKGNYYMNASTVYIKDPAKYIPNWLEKGSYYVRVEGFQTGASIGCYEFLFHIA
ncbi:UNVERIFIED_CONTAM: hypothetical protein RMT77_011315 [Armadillidium vulgare]